MQAGTGREVLLQAAVAAPSMHNTQPWRFRFDENTIEVFRDRARELPAEDPDGRMLHLSLGAACFNLRVAAAHLGLRAIVGHVVDPDRPDLVAVVELSPDGPPADIGGLYESIPLRRTNRNPYLDTRLPVRTRVADLLSRMSLEEKAGQMTQA